MMTALALLLALAGPADTPPPGCAHVRLSGAEAPARPGQPCRVVLYEPAQRAPGPDCRVARAVPDETRASHCRRIRIHETRRDSTVRAGDAIHLDAVSLAGLEGGVGEAGIPVVLLRGGGTVIVQSSASAHAGAHAQASARAGAHVSVRTGHHRGH